MLLTHIMFWLMLLTHILFWLMLLTHILFWIYTQKLWFYLLWFSRWASFDGLFLHPLHSVFFISQLREKCVKQKITNVHYHQKIRINLFFCKTYKKRFRNKNKLFASAPFKALLNGYVLAIKTFITHKPQMLFKLNNFFVIYDIMRTN